MDKVRVRFAPSPTGPLHIGGVRTALYNFLFARKHGGEFLLRIEDTDSSRFVPGAEDYIVESLQWLGVEIDEGIGAKKPGPHAPYRQSERKNTYQQYVQYLLNQKLAYYAFDTNLELEAKRAEIPNFQYDASTRYSMVNALTLTDEEVQERLNRNEPYVVRIKIEPNREIVVNDLIRGEVVVNSSVLDDKVLYKSSDELPTYHMANVVDDYLMQISHVIRGEEWLPSAPLHVLLYQYLGWSQQMPSFAHLPLLLKPEGSGKLSKRDGDRLGFPVFPLNWLDPKSGENMSGYRESGYFPEALLNFLALLGWNPGSEKEIFSLEELIPLFSLERVSKSGAKFDYEKAKWFNHQYLQLKPIDEITDIFQHLLVEKDIIEDSEKVQRIVALVRERATFIQDIWQEASFFFIRPSSYCHDAVKKRWKEHSPAHVLQFANVLSALHEAGEKNVEAEIKQWIHQQGWNMGAVMNAVRLALVGASKGPHIFDIIDVLGINEAVARLRKAAFEIQA